MADVLPIDDIKPGMKSWAAIITVQEKQNVGVSSKSPTKYQRYVFVDSTGAKVQGILFDDAIEKMGPRLQFYKKYKISKAWVRPILEQYQTEDLKVQWVISTRTVVEEIADEERAIVPFNFSFTEFKDFPSYIDSKTQTIDVLAIVIDGTPVIPVNNDLKESCLQRFVLVNEEMNPIVLSMWNQFVENVGKELTQQLVKCPVIICRRLKVVSYNGITLTTRNDSVILIDPPIREATQLKNWANRNEKSIVSLVQNKTYNNRSPKMFYQPHQKLTSIIDILPTQKVSYHKIIENQKYWYMSCVRCRRLTSANYGDIYTCNHCNEKQKAVPRCRFDVDLIDDTDTITALVFGELAEGLLKMTALEAMEYYNKNIDLPLDKVHEELKTKMFIVQIKPGTTKEGNSHKRYTIEYYFEDTSEIKSIEYPGENSTQHKHIEDKQPSSPKARVRLETRFEESETKQQRFSDMNSIEYAKENSSQNISTATDATITMISQSGKEHPSSKPKMLL